MKIQLKIGNFRLNGGESTEDFANREKALFDQLSKAERSFKKDVDYPDSDNVNDDEMKKNFVRSSAEKKLRNEARQFRGKESIFKQKESLNYNKNNKNVIPDYHKNPHKWIKYTLDDVSGDVSDKKNSQIALSFLKELKSRKSQEASSSSSSSSSSTSTSTSTSSSSSFDGIIFKKPLNKLRRGNGNAEEITSDDKPFYRGSKLVLPEYQVGQKKTAIHKNKKIKSYDKISCKQLKLHHLNELYDEDN